MKKKGFGSDYAEKAHLQKSFNSKIILELVESISAWYPNTRDNPLKILDLCCGDGGSTYEFLQKLDERNICVNELLGYDISQEQINRTDEYSCKDPRLKFKKQDVEIMNDIEKYDVIISLFGLHWMEDIKNVSKKIHNALKPNGKLMFFVPLEKPDLFQIRKDFMSLPQWKPYFKDLKLYPFIENENEYIQAFEQYFIHCTYKRGEEDKIFSEEDFMTFLSSWMQELRYISKDARLKYLKELVESIPHEVYPNVSRFWSSEDSAYKIRFKEHFFKGLGVKS